MTTTMTQDHFYNGILYKVEYKPQLSNSDYTQHKVYHIETEDESYPHARRAIESIMADILGYKQDYIWTEGAYNIWNKRNPSMETALHPYYKFTYDESIDKYVYTFVRPYDD